MINEIFTRDEFNNVVNNMSGRNYSLDKLNEARSYSYAPVGSKTIFLSHSHDDANIVLKARKFFEGLGISIYVDWADKSMPIRTCRETAAKIKEKIQGNNFFVFLATDRSIKSMWCNWEVGYGDSFKYKMDKILILPLASNRINWVGNEYLRLYPYVIRKYEGNNHNIASYYVCYPNGDTKGLSEWFNR